MCRPVESKLDYEVEWSGGRRSNRVVNTKVTPWKNTNQPRDPPRRPASTYSNTIHLITGSISRELWPQNRILSSLLALSHISLEGTGHPRVSMLVLLTAPSSVHDQGSGWCTLWERGESDLWDRGKPSPALVHLVEQRSDIVPSRDPDGRRRKALVPVIGVFS